MNEFESVRFLTNERELLDWFDRVNSPTPSPQREREREGERDVIETK